MPTVHDLREQKSQVVTDMRRLLTTAETEKRSLNPDEQTAFDQFKAKVVGLEQDEQRALTVEDFERSSLGQPVDKSRNELESRISLVEAIAGQVEGRSLTGALAEFNQEQKRLGVQAKGVLVPKSLFEKRAPQTTTTAAGIVPDDFKASEFVGLLRNSLAVKSLGARVLPNLRGSPVIPRQATTATAQWISEGEGLNDTGITFDNIRMDPHHIGCITELSRELLQTSNPSIEQLVRDDFIQVVSLAVDKAMLHGDGVKQPKGILATAGIETGTMAAPTWEALLVLLQKLAMNNVSPNAWITHPEVATKLAAVLKSPTAGSEFLLANGRMAGLPVTVTKQLDKKAAKGRILLGDFSELLIGTWGSVDVLTNQFAEGPYSRGAVQVRILTTMDCVARRANAFCLVDDVTL